MPRDASVVPLQLQRLIRKADATAVKADAVVREAIRDIRGALALAASEEAVSTSAAAREKIYARIRNRMAKLQKRLDDLLRASLNYAGKVAAERAADATGVQVRYSRRHADEVVALISPQQGENLAAVFTDKMTQRVIGALRNAVVSAFRENAVAGGSMQGLATAINRKWQQAAKRNETFRFTDSSGRTWDTRTYVNMNTRTNAMRVYNDLLIENLAAATGSDLVMVSRGGDPHCDKCAPWEGVILSVSGKTKGFPTYDDAKAAGCFHPNCIHTLEAVDETADADEIERQRSIRGDSASERKRKIEEARLMSEGKTAASARISVLRETLADALRNGLIVEDAEEIVEKLTDAQILSLCKGGVVPKFEPAKGTKKNPDPERWKNGSRGGVIHIRREGLTASRLAEVCGL